MTVAYAREPELSPEAFRDVLVASTLGSHPARLNADLLSFIGGSGHG